MKKKIIYAFFLVFVILTAPACEKTCNFCKRVTRDSGGTVVSSESETEYCGADLVAIKAILPVTVAGNTTKYECR